ncbi:hypothetical protein DFH08DRAFT_829314 [Mycena albidolilacea]|uniref:F-box domain-containing protein n=1 Tax=Mycena albidolilacea TaxID=1033008 RepID=A0AAD7ATV1_9AGAR|nr:hypothetical protein DFH08DRAFT_829314 [Mycena albidolilacea]
MSSPAADRARVADLDAQISFLERSLSELQSEKQLVLERLNSYKYPVLTVPTEIIAEIFVHFLPIYPVFSPLVGPDSPTLLTHICRKWREIALTTPTLWRAISLMDFAIPSGDQDKLVYMWLARSRCLPLHLHFSWKSAPWRAAEVLASVVPHRTRWEYLHTRLQPYHLHILEGPMPLLRRLSWLPIDSNGPTTRKFACHEAPLLRTAILNNAAAGSVILPWAQLTSLTLLWVFPQECVPILQHTSNLVDCKLALLRNDGATLPDIILPSLRSLSLDNNGSITGFLEKLNVPALHDLQIAESFLGSNTIHTLASFLSKSRCQLQELCITNRGSVSEESYRQAFTSMKVSFENRINYVRFESFLVFFVFWQPTCLQD